MLNDFELILVYIFVIYRGFVLEFRDLDGKHFTEPSWGIAIKAAFFFREV